MFRKKKKVQEHNITQSSISKASVLKAHHRTHLYQVHRDKLYALSNPENLHKSALICFKTMRQKQGNGVFHQISFVENWVGFVPESVFINGIEPSIDYIENDSDLIVFEKIGLLGSLKDDDVFAAADYYTNAYLLDINDIDINVPLESKILTIIDAVNDILRRSSSIKHIQFPLQNMSESIKEIIESKTAIRVRDHITLTNTEKLIDRASDELRAYYVTSFINDHETFHWRIDHDVPYGVLSLQDESYAEFSIKTDYPVDISHIELKLSKGAIKRSQSYNLHLEGPVDFPDRLSTLPDLRALHECQIESLVIENTFIEAEQIINAGLKPDIIEIIEDENNVQAYMLALSGVPLANYVGFQEYKYSWDDFVSVITGATEPVHADDILSYVGKNQDDDLEADLDKNNTDDDLFD